MPFSEFMSVRPSSGQWQGAKKENSPLVVDANAE